MGLIFEINFILTAGVRSTVCGAKTLLDPLWDNFMNTAGVTRTKCGVEIVRPAVGLRQILEPIL